MKHVIGLSLLVLAIGQVQGKFLFSKKASFIGRLFQKVTEPQPNHCFPFCGCGSPNSINHHPTPGIHLEPNEYPWLALIYDPNDLMLTYPGTLINDKYIVSSASNFYGKSPHQLKVKLGYHFNCQYEKTSITFSVIDVIYHPLYSNSPEHLDNDIALLKLSNSVHFNHEISPICLPSAKGVDYNGHVGYLASWNIPGKTPFHKPTINCTPRKYQLPITSHFHCTENMSIESEACIGVYGAKSLLCQRDSGAGVFHKNNDHYELVGVLSHRQSCGELILSPLVIKDQLINDSSSSSSSNTSISVNVTNIQINPIVEDLKMKAMPMTVDNKTMESVKEGRKLHSLKQSDETMQIAGDHDYDPLPVFTRIDHHLHWILENTRDSCYCRPRFFFSINFRNF